MSQATRMRWLLLRTMAQNKLYVPFTTDSMMKEAVDYYNQHGTAHDRMTANYLLGSVYRDMGEAPAALHAFQQAVENADTLSADCDYTLLAKVCAQMGLIFNNQYLPSEALRCFNMAASHAIRANDTLLALNFLQQTIVSHYEMGHRHEVMRLSDSIHRLYTERGKMVEAAQTLSTAILTALQIGDTASAHKYLRFVDGNINEEQFNDRRWAVFRAYKGKYALTKGFTDEAEMWFRRLLDGEDDNPDLKVFAYKGLRDVYQKRHQPDSMVKYAGLYCDVNDSSNLFTHQTVVERMQSQYQYERWRQESLMNENRVRHRNRLIAAMCVGLLVLCGCGYGWYQRQEEKNKRTRMEQIIRFQNLQDTHRKAHEELGKMRAIKNDMEALLRQKEETIQGMEQQIMAYDALPYDVGQSKNDALKTITDQLHQIASKAEKASTLQLQNLRKTAYSAEPLWRPKIQAFDYKMSLRDEHVCLLIRLGFSATEISVLLGLSPQALSNQKKRLLANLFHVEGPASELNDKLAGL